MAPANVAGAFIHRLMINPSLPAARAAVKYSPSNEIDPGESCWLLRRDSPSTRIRPWQ
jgi:hypothetical protein